MADVAFKQVDVFTDRPFRGNPVAVVFGADRVDAAEMQRIAAWTNLSETTFLLSPSVMGADYRLRIFTPRSEIPFAGHPTIGSAHAVLESGMLGPRPRAVTQECLAGLVRITVEEGGLFAAVPRIRIMGEHAAAAPRIGAALGVEVPAAPPPLAIDVGPTWLVACLADRETLGRVTPDLPAIVALGEELGVGGVTVYALGEADGAAVHVRSFAPAAGVAEDPVCGSGNAAVGVHLAHGGLLARTGERYLASQGTELGRAGRVTVRVHDGGRRVEIGGAAVTAVDGRITVG